MERDKAEEILRKHCKYMSYPLTPEIIDAMLEFAEQSRITEQKSSVVVTDEEIRKVVLSFWFYWYNYPGGTNTEQAFDDWWSKNKSQYWQLNIKDK